MHIHAWCMRSLQWLLLGPVSLSSMQSQVVLIILVYYKTLVWYSFLSRLLKKKMLKNPLFSLALPKTKQMLFCYVSYKVKSVRSFTTVIFRIHVMTVRTASAHCVRLCLQSSHCFTALHLNATDPRLLSCYDDSMKNFLPSDIAYWEILKFELASPFAENCFGNHCAMPTEFNVTGAYSMMSTLPILMVTVLDANADTFILQLLCMSSSTRVTVTPQSPNICLVLCAVFSRR